MVTPWKKSNLAAVARESQKTSEEQPVTKLNHSLRC